MVCRFHFLCDERCVTLAVEKGRYEVVDLLLPFLYRRLFPKLTITNILSSSIRKFLKIAAMNGDRRMVDLLLSKAISRRSDGLEDLSEWAAEGGHIDLAREFAIEYPRKDDPDKVRCLSYSAAMGGHTKAALALMETPPSLVELNGVLMCALVPADLELIGFTLDRGATIKASALRDMRSNGFGTIVTFLRNRYPKVLKDIAKELANEANSTPSIEVIKWIIEENLLSEKIVEDILLRSSVLFGMQGRDPVAEDNNRFETIRFLFEAGHISRLLLGNYLEHFGWMNKIQLEWVFEQLGPAADVRSSVAEMLTTMVNSNLIFGSLDVGIFELLIGKIGGTEIVSWRIFRFENGVDLFRILLEKHRKNLFFLQKLATAIVGICNSMKPYSNPPNFLATRFRGAKLLHIIEFFMREGGEAASEKIELPWVLTDKSKGYLAEIKIAKFHRVLSKIMDANLPNDRINNS